jgi:hypothetical protein
LLNNFFLFSSSSFFLFFTLLGFIFLNYGLARHTELPTHALGLFSESTGNASREACCLEGADSGWVSIAMTALAVGSFARTRNARFFTR